MSQANRLKLPSKSAVQQAENKAAWNKTRSRQTADFFTIGYTGRSLSEIIEALQSVGVRSLIDIRQNPVSMYRPELSKGNLKRAIEQHGLNYFHLPELGVPRDIRAKAIEKGNRGVIWDWYDEFVAEPYAGRNLHKFFNGMDHPVALMCVELDPQECHRHRLMMVLEQMGLRGFDL